MALDRKIELDALSEEELNEMMLTINAEVLKLAKIAQTKINKLLNRFSVECDLSLSYRLLPAEINDDLATSKKQRSRKKI